MNSQQLERMRNDKGFIAALDQSGGSTPQALLHYGITENSYSTEEEMYDLVHQMRTRVMTSPVFTCERILGVIMFENTMHRTVDGLPTPDYLWERRAIVPFLKIDRGLDEPDLGVRLMKDIPDLPGLLREAGKAGIFGTKMRSFIQDANATGIAEVVAQQFAIARLVIKAGLVPIIEPEIDIQSEEKGEAEIILKQNLQAHLDKMDRFELVMFKLSLPENDDFYLDLIRDPRVLRVVALSGGYSRAEANARLGRNHGMVASFSRALMEGITAGQSDEQFNATLDDSIQEIYEASLT
ncbi:MAG: fructose bisphosphate aldolase [Planctomycetes bacterium]|nr:fructose bisphosphate aldolase [Planctomycetota bacterium]